MQLDTATLALIVGIIATAVTVLGKIADKLIDTLANVVKDRRGNGTKAVDTERRAGQSEVMANIERLTAAIVANTTETRDIAQGNLELKVRLSEGILLLGTSLEHHCADLSAHCAQVREFEQRVVGDIKDARDQVIAAVRQT
jgi:hypothetical protein